MKEHDNPKIISMGVLNVDFVMELGNEKIGEKKMGRHISINAGGHGSAQAIAAVRCGIPTAAVGCVGNDAFGMQIRQTLESENVDCRFLRQMEEDHSGLATIIVEEGRENIFIDFLGTNFKLEKDDIERCRPELSRASLAMIHMGPAAMEVSSHMVKLANECHIPVLVNPASYSKIPDDFWSEVDYLVMNMPQASGLCGLKGENVKTARIAAGMLSGRVRHAVVIQMDENGVLVAENGVMTVLDQSRNTKVVDHSGATAFFVGVFGAELVKGKSVQQAAIKAHRAAMLCMERVGVYAAFPSAEVLRGM